MVRPAQHDEELSAIQMEGSSSEDVLALDDVGDERQPEDQSEYGQKDHQKDLHQGFAKVTAKVKSPRRGPRQGERRSAGFGEQRWRPDAHPSTRALWS